MSECVVIIVNQAESVASFRGHLIRSIIANSGRVVVFAPNVSPESASAIRALGAEVVEYPLQRTGMNPIKDVGSFVRLIGLLRLYKPSVVLSCMIKPVIYGTLAATVANIPRRFAMIEGLGYAFTKREGASLMQSLLRRVVTWMYRVSLKFATLVFVLNEDDLRELSIKAITSPKKLVNLHGIGVDLEEWRCAPPPTEPVTFLMAARLLVDKGVREYVEAARQVKASSPNVRFILIGGLDENPAGITLEEANAWVSEGVVEWPGHVRMKEFLEKASVFVLPSYREGMPRTTQEAMAAGRPVITTDAPGCRETVIAGENGYLVAPREVAELVVAMNRFVRNPELIQTMGEASRRRAELMFDVHKINARLVRQMGLEASPEVAVPIN